jgi:hypothetical protein
MPQAGACRKTPILSEIAPLKGRGRLSLLAEGVTGQCGRR